MTKQNTLQGQPQIIHDFIMRFAESLWNETHDRLEGIMLTGSFSAWLKSQGNHCPSWSAIPDVNIYPLSHGSITNIIKVEQTLMKCLGDTIQGFRAEGRPITVLIDMHPFSISTYEFKDHTESIQLQLTSRVINLDMADAYPPYCWHGWLSNNILLYKKHDRILEKVLHRGNLRQDGEWLRSMYLALVSYGNVLQMLPMFTGSKPHLFDEAYRYSKEITKDGFSIVLTQDEYRAGKSFELLHGWKNQCREFYLEKYGVEAHEIVSRFIDIDENYMRCRLEMDPYDLIEKNLRLREIVFERFKEKLNELKNDVNFMDAFKEMPLWW